MNLEELNTSLRTDIPLFAVMGLEVIAASDSSVSVRIPIESNLNDKGTLFAGSSYSALVLAGWTLAMCRAQSSGFERPWAAVVDAHVHYAKAIRETVVATASFLEEPHLVPGERNWAKIQVVVDDPESVTGASRPGLLAFEGTYAVGVKK